MTKFNFRAQLAAVLGLWFVAAGCGAGVLQNWASLGPGYAGTFVDNDGSTIDFRQVDGPKPGERALQMKIHLVGWGGLWSSLDTDLSRMGAVRFMAKSSQPEIVEVGFLDRQKVRYVAILRVLSGDWKEFVVPFSLFKRDAYQMPEAPSGRPLEWSEIRSLQFLPQTHGDAILDIGPVSFQKGKPKAQTGAREEKNAVLVQDFAFFDKSACGPYNDGKTGSTINLLLEKDPKGQGTQFAKFHCDLKAKGWVGYWMRAGDAWGGQDWNGAKAFTMEVYTSEAMKFQIGFNDTNQNAYVAETAVTQGNGWEKLSIPFGQFKLNPYYQPPGAKKGLPQDLSHVETINVAPETEGQHDYQIREITLEK